MASLIKRSGYDMMKGGCVRGPKEETQHIRPAGCICNPFDLAAMGHMTNCPCFKEQGDDELLGLAARCEAATTEQEEGMVRRAFIALFPEPPEPHYQTGAQRFYFTAEYAEWTQRDCRFRQLMSVRAFLDAAMTLANSFGGELIFFKDSTAKAFLWQPYPMAVEAKAASPALALCAAALRARAKISGGI
jgi:hypothetical protein